MTFLEIHTLVGIFVPYSDSWAILLIKKLELEKTKLKVWGTHCMDKLVICKLWLQVLVMQLPEAEFLSKQLQNQLLLLNQIWTISVHKCKINRGVIEKVVKFPGM